MSYDATTTLAELFDIVRLPRARVTSAVEVVRPDIAAWSRSGAADSVPPKRLAHRIGTALGPALSVPLACLLAAKPGWTGAQLVKLDNRPHLLILTSQGQGQFKISLLATLTIERIASHASATGAASWAVTGVLEMRESGGELFSVMSEFKKTLTLGVDHGGI